MAKAIKTETAQTPAPNAPIGETECALIAQTAQQPRPGEEPGAARLRAAVDIAAIRFMHDCLLRVGVAADVHWHDLQRTEDGSGLLTTPKSKTNPAGYVVYVTARAMSALDEMRSIKQALESPCNPAAGDSPMTAAASDPQIVPRPPAAAPALLAADEAVADALESVLSDNTRRVYGAQWRIFTDWCDSVVLRALPADPLTVARYLAVRASAGASVATLRLAASAIAKAHQWAGHESPGQDPGVRVSLKGWGRRLAKSQRQAGALTADVLSVSRLTAPKPRARGRGLETAEQAAQRARFDLVIDDN